MADTSADIRILPGAQASLADRQQIIDGLDSPQAERPNLTSYALDAERLGQDGCLIAYVGQAPCGLLVTTRLDQGPNCDGLWLDVMAVLPDAQRLGVARALMMGLRDWARDNGCGGIELHVDDDNRRAIGLFEAMGFHTQSRFMRLETGPNTASGMT